MKYFSFIVTLIFLSLPFLVEGQIELEVKGCNNITAHLSKDLISDEMNTCWIEKLIAPNVWSQKSKVHSNLRSNDFNNLEQGEYRVTYILPKTAHRTAKSKIISKIISVTKCSASEKKERDLESNKFTIAPNPVKNTVHLSIEDFNPNADTEVSIYGITGQMVLSEKVNSNTLAIDMSSHHSGTYLIQVKVDGESVYFEKMILITQ